MTTPTSPRTFVYYHLPQDHDDPDYPNVYRVWKYVNDTTLGDIKSAFPLPGIYHFRFKMKLGSSYVWVDVGSDSSLIPVFQSRIVAKVLRLPKDHDQSGFQQNVRGSSGTVTSSSNPSPGSMAGSGSSAAPQAASTHFESRDSTAISSNTTVGRRPPGPADCLPPSSTKSKSGHSDPSVTQAAPPARSQTAIPGFTPSATSGGGESHDFLLLDNPQLGGGMASSGMTVPPSHKGALSGIKRETPSVRGDDLDRFFGE